jgi:hypothetical protein
MPCNLSLFAHSTPRIFSRTYRRRHAHNYQRTGFSPNMHAFNLVQAIHTASTVSAYDVAVRCE